MFPVVCDAILVLTVFFLKKCGYDLSFNTTGLWRVFLGGFMDLVIQLCLLILFTVVCNHGYCSFLFYFF